MLQILHHDLSDDLIRLAAYDLLVRLEIRSLPVDFLQLFESDPSIQYGSVQYLADYFQLPVETILSIDQAGFIYRERHGIDQIYINKATPTRQIIWNTALAIGALELDAVPYDTCFGISQKLRSVTDFAYYFLAPDVVLDACRFHTQAEIFQYCLLPFQESVKKAKRMNMKFQFFRRKPIGAEKIVLSNFGEYIEKIRFIKETSD